MFDFTFNFQLAIPSDEGTLKVRGSCATKPVASASKIRMAALWRDAGDEGRYQGAGGADEYTQKCGGKPEDGNGKGRPHAAQDLRDPRANCDIRNSMKRFFTARLFPTIIYLIHTW